MCVQKTWHVIASSGCSDGGLSVHSPHGFFPFMEVQGVRKDIPGTKPLALHLSPVSPARSACPSGGEQSPLHLGAALMLSLCLRLPATGLRSTLWVALEKPGPSLCQALQILPHSCESSLYSEVTVALPNGLGLVTPLTILVMTSYVIYREI